ncbi:MAG: hypothetical protein KIC46_09595 [Clostridiales bacterium]|nr:hypothetical protein [Clostridiales bacterium]
MSDGVKILLRVLGSIALGFAAYLLSLWIPPFWVGMTVVIFLGLSILGRIWELGDLVEAGFWPEEKKEEQKSDVSSDMEQDGNGAGQ